MEYTVTEKAMRPASPERRCFYCKEPIGQPHKTNCVLVAKRVKVRMSVVYEIKVPSFWDKEMILSSRNTSDWCQSNALEELEELEEQNGCLCGLLSFEYLNDTSDPYLDEI